MARTNPQHESNSRRKFKKRKRNPCDNYHRNTCDCGLEKESAEIITQAAAVAFRLRKVKDSAESMDCSLSFLFVKFIDSGIFLYLFIYPLFSFLFLFFFFHTSLLSLFIIPFLIESDQNCFSHDSSVDYDRCKAIGMKLINEVCGEIPFRCKLIVAYQTSSYPNASRLYDCDYFIHT